MKEETAEDLIETLEDIAESLRVLSGRLDRPGGMPGPIEAIAMLLGAEPTLPWRTVVEQMVAERWARVDTDTIPFDDET